MAELKDREATCQRLRSQVRRAKDAGNTELAAEGLREIRANKLWKELGFKSFNQYAKHDSPYSSNYTYKLSAH